MKILLSILFVILFAGQSVAGQWCQWDGSKGVNCQSDHRGYIVINGYNVKTPAIANAEGFYKVIETYPIITSDQVITTEQWSAPVGNHINKTWEFRDKTAIEIDQEIAQPMSVNDYYQWKAMIFKGLITEQEAASLLPPELVNAYLARERLMQ